VRYQFQNPPRSLPGDAERFLTTLNGQTGFFDNHAPIWVARAPGRLDLMGGFGDYSGSLVLQLPLSVAAYAAVQSTSDPFLTLHSTSAASQGDADTIQIPLADLQPVKPLSYPEAKTLLSINPKEAWGAYVAGALVVLHRERGVRLAQGARLFLHSEVPLGKGISSSAAIEVASMAALSALLGISLEGRELALLCQKVENDVVGAPCGVMDQMTAACGEENRLLALLCQPAECQPSVMLPPHLEVWGVDSGIRHAVSGAGYTSVRIGTYMGYRILADLAGLDSETAGEGRVRVTDPRWNGYLANVEPEEWERDFRARIPATLAGSDFLQRYLGTNDIATRVDPAQVYPVLYPTEHPIYENRRVCEFRSILEQARLTDRDCLRLGELMAAAHESYDGCGIGSDGTSRLVEMARKAGPACGIYGAKITGGGCGGMVAVLAERGSAEQVQSIAGRYSRETGRESAVVGGSSPGTLALGLLSLI
jgi:L-arabinokinase